jgi:hypothetical protein
MTIPCACGAAYETSTDIHMVQEFLDVFPDELPGMPPKRAIEFKIEL